MAKPDFDKLSWHKAMMDTDLPASTKQVLSSLFTWASVVADGNLPAGTCYPSYASIAKRASLKRIATINHIDLAVKAGWVRKWKHPSYKANMYTLLRPVKGASVVPLSTYYVPQGTYGKRPSTFKNATGTNEAEKKVHEVNPNKSVNKLENMELADSDDSGPTADSIVAMLKSKKSVGGY